MRSMRSRFKAPLQRTSAIHRLGKSNTKTGSRSTTLKSLSAAATAICNGLINALILAVSAHRGDVDEIAVYAIANSVIPLAAIIAGGGAPLLYVSGNEEQRTSVRSQWVFVVLPTLVATTSAYSFFYAERGYSFSLLLAAGSVAVLNNASQLQLGDLSRQMRVGAAAAVVCGSKAIALALTFQSFGLNTALLIAGIIQFALAEVALRKTSWMRPRVLRTLSFMDAVRAHSMNRNLFSYSLAELLSGRISTIALSLSASSRTMGAFGTVVSIYQAMGGVLYTALQVPMAAKSRVRQKLDDLHRVGRSSEAVVIVGASVAAPAVILVSRYLTDSVLHLPQPEAAIWLTLAASALPFFVINRAIMLDHIGNGKYLSANLYAWLVTSSICAALLGLMPAFGFTGAASAALAGELFAALVAAVLAARKRIKPKPLPA